MRDALPCITASVNNTAKPAMLSTSPTPCVMLFASSTASLRIEFSPAIFVPDFFCSRQPRNKQSYLWMAFPHRKTHGSNNAMTKRRCFSRAACGSPLCRFRSRRFRPNAATSSRPMPPPINPHSQPVSQQNSHDHRVQQRLAHIRLHQPVIMNHAQNRAPVNRPMQHLPALSSQPSDHSRRRSHRQRNHQHERGKSHGDEPPLLHVLPHLGPREKFIEPNPRTEMQAAIKKREKPQHAPETNQLRLPQNFP